MGAGVVTISTGDVKHALDHTVFALQYPVVEPQYPHLDRQWFTLLHGCPVQPAAGWVGGGGGGVGDGVGLEVNGDGVVDAVGLDVDGDGVGDEVDGDRVGDGVGLEVDGARVVAGGASAHVTVSAYSPASLLQPSTRMTYVPGLRVMRMVEARLYDEHEESSSL